MTAPALRTTARPPFDPSADLITDEDAAQALSLVAAGRPLTEAEARFDLGRNARKFGPKPDSFWGERWGWTARDVDVLRDGDWRTRPELPTPKGHPIPDRPNGREERERENDKYRRRRGR